MPDPAAQPAALYRWDGARPPGGRPARVALLGATGSIGTQTVDLALRYPDRIRIAAVTTRGRVDALAAVLARLAAGAPPRRLAVGVSPEGGWRLAFDGAADEPREAA